MKHLRYISEAIFQDKFSNDVNDILNIARDAGLKVDYTIYESGTSHSEGFADMEIYRCEVETNGRLTKNMMMNPEEFVKMVENIFDRLSIEFENIKMSVKYYTNGRGTETEVLNNLIIDPDGPDKFISENILKDRINDNIYGFGFVILLPQLNP